MLLDLLRRAWVAALPPFAAVALYIWKLWTRQIRGAQSAIQWDPEEKVWKVFSYRDIVSLMKRPEVRANYLPGLMEDLDSNDRKRFFFLQSFFSRWPLFQDGESQARTHRVLAAQFTSLKLQGRIREIVGKVVAELIAANIERTGAWDLVECYAKRFPLRVIIDVLGFQRSDEPDLKRWADTVEEWFGGRGETSERFAACQQALEAYWERAEILMQQKLPEDCVASELQRAEERGELKVAEVIPNLFFLMSAGHETTSSFVSNTMVPIPISLCNRYNAPGTDKLLVLKDPALERRIRACVSAPNFTINSPEFDEIIEELLRYTCPIKCMYRQVGQDFEFEDIAFKKGQQIHFLNYAANSDPSIFPDPGQIIPGRRNGRKHVTFGLQEHICPGMRLGKMMGKVAIAELLLRMPNIRLAVPADQIQRLPLDSISALESLPVIHSAR